MLTIKISISDGDKESSEAVTVWDRGVDDLEWLIKQHIRPMLHKMRERDFEMVITPAKTEWRYVK